MSNLDPMAVLKRCLENIADEFATAHPNEAELADVKNSFTAGWEMATEYAARRVRALAGTITIEGQ